MKERSAQPEQGLLRRWLPSPPLTVFLFVMWLLLNGSVSPGHMLLGAALGVFGPLAAAALRPLQARPRSIWAMVKLGVTVTVDVIRSNFAVARIIIVGSDQAKLVSGFIRVPLELRDPHALSTLACILTITPGTVWSGLDEDTGILNLHVLDLRDEAQWIDFIKTRYERPLKEIFQ